MTKATNTTTCLQAANSNTNRRPMPPPTPPLSVLPCPLPQPHRVLHIHSQSQIITSSIITCKSHPYPKPPFFYDFWIPTPLLIATSGSPPSSHSNLISKNTIIQLWSILQKKNLLINANMHFKPVERTYMYSIHGNLVVYMYLM